MIPITKVQLGTEEEELVLEVLRSGQLAQGKYVEKFEDEFAALHGVNHAVAVNNGTTALVAAMQALEIGPGDEVITSPFTFVATLNAIIETGATARFADIGHDFNIDVTKIEPLINSRTRVIMPVHLYGYMAEMESIMNVSERYGCRVIEDAAQSVCASYGNHRAGSFDVGCFSLYATKNLTTGEGGIITTDDAEVADRLQLLRNQGMRRRYEYELAGHNYRMTNLSAAVGLPQLRRIESMNEKRQINAQRLREGLTDVEGLELPPDPASGRTHVYHQFTARIDPGFSIERDYVVDELSKRGVGSGIYYPRVVFDYECYLNNPLVARDHVPNAFLTAGQVFSLPVHPLLTEHDLEMIIQTVREVFA